MKANLKIFGVAALAAVMAVGATGCGITMRPPEDIEKELNELIKDVDFTAGNNYQGSLEIWTMTTKSEQDNINALVESFKAAYPNITVKTQHPANYQDELINQNAYAESQKKYGEMPDIFWTSNEDVPTYVAKSMLMPLSFFVDADENFSTDGLVQTMVKDATFADYLYFMPRDYNQITMYYNREIFEKADVPDPGTYKDESGKVRAMTKQEFGTMIRDVAEWMAETDEKTAQGQEYATGYALEIQSFWNSLNYAIFKGNHADLVDQYGMINLESDEAVKTIFDLWDLAYNDICSPMTEVAKLAHALFIQGLSAVCLDVRSSLSDIVASAPKIPGVCETLGVAPSPNLSDGEYYVGAGCSGYAMYRHSDDPTAAWLFLKHVVSEAGQNAFCQTGNGCPVLKSMFEDETSTWKNIKQENPALYAKLPDDFNHDAFVYQYETAGVTLEYLDEIPREAQEAVTKGMREAVISAVSNVVPSLPDQYLADPAKFRFEIDAHIRTIMQQSIAKMNQAIEKAQAQEDNEEEKDKEEREKDETEQTTQGNS